MAANQQFESKHHRGPHGRWIKGAAKLLKRDEASIGRIEGSFKAHDLPTPAHAEAFAGGHRRRLKPDALGNFHHLAAALRAGDATDPQIARIDAGMDGLTHDLVLTRHVDPAAFGLKDATLAGGLQKLVGKKIADKAYFPTALHQADGAAGVTMHISAPNGTRALVAGDNEVWLGRDIELAITGVEPNGRGGYNMHLVVLPPKPVRKTSGPKKATTAAVAAASSGPKPASTSAGYGLNGPVKDTEAATHRALVRYHEATARGLYDKAREYLRDAAVASRANPKLAKSLSAVAERDVPPNSPKLEAARFNKHQRLAGRHEHAAREAEKTSKDVETATGSRASAGNEAAAKSAKLAQWRADAAKPGRVVSTKTKRETYVASWQSTIDQMQRSLNEAEAGGDAHAVHRLRGDLTYYTSARDAIATRVDPTLDDASLEGGDLAQKVNAARPLAVYGDMLHLDAQDDDWTYANAAALEQIPPELHGKVAKRMAASSTGGIWIGEGGISGLDHAGDLRGQTPRGWDNGQTFEDVNGVYRPGARTMIIGRTENSKFRGARTASHEFGHALDNALGDLSAERDWQAIHDQAVAMADHRLSPYFKQPGSAGQQEFWAEAFWVWTKARLESTSQGREATIREEFGVPFAVAGQILDYFDRIAHKNGVTE